MLRGCLAAFGSVPGRGLVLQGCAAYLRRPLGWVRCGSSSTKGNAVVTRIRKIGVLLLATPLATGLSVLAAPTSVSAAGARITSPATGAVITHGSQVTVRGTFEAAIGIELRVQAPGQGDRVVASGGIAGKLSGQVDIRRNGKYVARMRGAVTGYVYDTSTFYVRVPPAVPSGVSGSVSGSTLTVRWNLGNEDDLTRYSVSAGGIGSASGSPVSLCGGTSCSKRFTLGAGDTGSTTVSVRAYRSNGQGGSVASGASSDTVTLPGSGGGGGGGDGGGIGGGGGGGSDPGGGTGTLPPPNIGGNAPQVPITPMNQNSPINLPSVRPDDAEPGFAYQPPQVASPMREAASASSSATLEWGRSVALALVLLLLAAHLSAWTRRVRIAQAGMSSRGMAARIARGGTGRTRVKRTQKHIAQATAKSAAASRRRNGRKVKVGGPPQTKSARRAKPSTPRLMPHSAPAPGPSLGSANNGTTHASVHDLRPADRRHTVNRRAKKRSRS